MPLSDKEYDWFRNERELIILHVKEVKSLLRSVVFLLCLSFFLLFTWIFCVSIDVRLRMKQEVDRLVEPRRLDTQIVEKKIDLLHQKEVEPR